MWKRGQREQDPYAEGWDAAKRGQSIDDNPYEIGYDECRLWDEGFMDRRRAERQNPYLDEPLPPVQVG